MGSLLSREPASPSPSACCSPCLCVCVCVHARAYSLCQINKIKSLKQNKTKSSELFHFIVKASSLAAFWDRRCLSLPCAGLVRPHLVRITLYSPLQAPGCKHSKQVLLAPPHPVAKSGPGVGTQQAQFYCDVCVSLEPILHSSPSHGMTLQGVPPHTHTQQKPLLPLP